MSTGKRIGKRSIVGTRVACWLEDGKYYPGMICNVKTPYYGSTIYSVRIDGEKKTLDLKESDLVGSGFTAVNSIKLRPDQKVYITHNQREVIGNVIYHRPNIDEVLISVVNKETGIQQDVKKRLEDIRLLESRKSARLADSDTDFAKLADCASERMNRKSSSTIDVPMINGSRKRRNWQQYEDDDDITDECAAALVLMKLSVSPRSPYFDAVLGVSPSSPASSVVWSMPPGTPKNDVRLNTPSPPLSESSPTHQLADDGIDMEDLYDFSGPRKRRSSTRIMFKCTWKGCQQIAQSCHDIEQHIRSIHLGRRIISSDGDSDSDDDHEEEFYWTEVEISVATNVDPAEMASRSSPQVSIPQSLPSPTTAIGFPNAMMMHPAQIQMIATSGITQNNNVTVENAPVQSFSFVSPPPTLSHMDMARPPHEDPDYGIRRTNSPNLSNSWPKVSPYSSANKLKARTNASPKGVGRGKRGGESRKCRKVYGMEQKDQWCTQCKWKKACSRFSE